jgi:hypothetical protein
LLLVVELEHPVSSLRRMRAHASRSMKPMSCGNKCGVHRMHGSSVAQGQKVRRISGQMNKITLAITVVFAAMSAPSFAQAQPQAAGGGHGGWQQDMTRAQAQQRADTMFQRLDLNHDGTVTRAEAQQAASQMPNGAERAERMIDRMFGQAQSVTQAQFEAQSLGRFDAQDVNHDGTVTAVERQQARALAHPERG